MSTLISNVTVADGSGTPRYAADVTLAEGLIARIASRATAVLPTSGLRATGWCSAPGSSTCTPTPTCNCW